MYAVVKFIHKDTVEAVPQSWLQTNICFWPPNGTTIPEIKKFIKKRKEPELNWMQCKVRVLKENIGGYYKAFYKSKKASGGKESTDKDNLGCGKRIKIEILSDLSSSEDEDVDNPPINNLTACLPTPPVVPETSSLQVKSEEDSVEEEGVQVFTTEDNCNLDFSQTDILPPRTNAEGISIWKNIHKCFQVIKTKLETIDKKVDKIEAQIDRLECSGTNPGLSSFPLNFLPPEIELPVKTEAELEELNENLKINRDLTEILVSYLHSIGTGKTPCSFVLSLCKKIMAQEVAVMYSRYGRKGKKSFSCSFRETQNVITAAASLKFKNADKEALSDMFGKALAGASDWNGRQPRPSENHT